MFEFIQVMIGVFAIVCVVGLVKPSLFHRFYKDLSRKHVLIAFIALIVFVNTPIGSWITARAEKEEAQQAIVDQEKAAKKAEQETQKKAQEAQTLAKKQEEEKKTERENLKTRLIEAQDEVKSIQTQGESWRKEGVAGIDAELIMFTSWTGTIVEAKKLNDPEMTELAKRLETQVSQAQVREFPLLRKAFTEHLDKKGWEFDLDATSYGAGNKTLELVNAAFAANKNIAQIHVALGDKIKLLRFTRVNYKWYSGASEYQYFTIDSLKDTEVALPKTE